MCEVYILIGIFECRVITIPFPWLFLFLILDCLRGWIFTRNRGSKLLHYTMGVCRILILSRIFYTEMYFNQIFKDQCLIGTNVLLASLWRLRNPRSLETNSSNPNTFLYWTLKPTNEFPPSPFVSAMVDSNQRFFNSSEI